MTHLSLKWRQMCRANRHTMQMFFPKQKAQERKIKHHLMRKYITMYKSIAVEITPTGIPVEKRVISLLRLGFSVPSPEMLGRRNAVGTVDRLLKETKVQILQEIF